ncbi:hypothetical protein [Diaminobutyricibacter sp. McL0608]|uniref:hypothetical protein n=1 Tax=Leifsonia sp. McL0608 TaxID=3143537 RepID=UPI0031F3145C
MCSAIVLALTGCAGGTGENHRKVPLPEKNLEGWVMPLDQFFETDRQSLAGDYAENLLMKPCMNDAGFEWEPPWRDLQAKGSPSVKEIGISIFNLSLAEQFGYGFGPSQDWTTIDQRAWVARAKELWTPAWQEPWEKCLKAARKVLPLSRNTQTANVLYSDAGEAARQRGDVKAAAAAWRKCMQPAGVPDLPEWPYGMPSQSISDKYDIDVAQRHDPSEEEIALAVMDANCRDSSGYSKTAYDAEWEEQVKLLNEHADELVADKAASNDYWARSMKVIDEYAPSRPAG